MQDEQWAMGEVRLWAMNTQSLYNNLMVDWLNNFQRKMKRGVFNIDLAVKGIAENFVPRVITDYNKQFPENKLPQISKSGKYYLARDFVNQILEQIDYKEGIMPKTKKRKRREVAIPSQRHLFTNKGIYKLKSWEY